MRALGPCKGVDHVVHRNIDDGGAALRGGLIHEAEGDVVTLTDTAIGVALAHISITQVIHHVRIETPVPAGGKPLSVIRREAGRRRTGKLEDTCSRVLLQIAADKQVMTFVQLVIELRDRSVQGRRRRRGKGERSKVEPVALGKTVSCRVLAEVGEHVWINARTPRTGAVRGALWIHGCDL